MTAEPPVRVLLVGPTVDRLDRLRKRLDAPTNVEVVRRALQALERELDTQLAESEHTSRHVIFL